MQKITAIYENAYQWSMHFAAASSKATSRLETWKLRLMMMVAIFSRRFVQHHIVQVFKKEILSFSGSTAFHSWSISYFYEWNMQVAINISQSYFSFSPM